MKTFPDYLERKIPYSGSDCLGDDAPYKNWMIGRQPTIFADYAQFLRKKHSEEPGQGWSMLADLIEIHYGEQRSHVFFDFFPASQRVHRIDDRTTGPDRGWKLDQDRRCLDDLRKYDSGGWVT